MLTIRRREFITLLGGAATAWPIGAHAQQRSTSKRIGWITTGITDRDPLIQVRINAFLEELAKVGWREGINLHLDHRMNSRDDGGRLLAAQLVATGPDLILCVGTPQTAIFRQLTTTIPIVFVNVADPVASGFVASFARPGGNITGFTSVEFSFAGKWLSILKDIAPGISRVMVLYDPRNSNWTGYLPSIESAAASLRVSVIRAPVVTLADADREIEAFAHEPGSGMIVLPALFVADREMLAALATRRRLPAIYPYDVYAESGGLVSYGSNFVDLFRHAVVYVDRILRGAKPGDLPIQAPVKFELIINLKSAKAIGLNVSPDMLSIADKVIE